MRDIFGIMMMIFSVLAFFYSTRIVYNKNFRNPVFVAFAVTALGSGLWNLCYGLSYMTSDINEYKTYKGIELLGIIIYFFAVQFLIKAIMRTNSRLFPIIIGVEALLGILIFSNITYNNKCYEFSVISDAIIVTYDNPTVYTIHIILLFVMSLLSMLLILFMGSAGRKRSIRAFGKYFLIIYFLIFAGMIIDTILPFYQIRVNIPATAFFQYVGLEILYYVIHKTDKNRINMQNLTAYIYNSLKVPVMVFDEDNHMRIANKEARGYFQCDTDRFKKDNFWKEVFDTSTPIGIMDSKESIIREGVDRNGRRCKLYIDPINDDYGDYLGYIVMVTDMTSLYKSMKELKESKNEALRANKAKSLFLANMSHEIRTPMNAILGLSELAINDEVNAKAKDYFNDIHNSAESLLAIINDILDISKIESGKMEISNEDYYFGKLIKEVFQIISIQAKKKNLAYDVDIDKNFPNAFYGDVAKVREILINILNNAVKYTEKGSIILRIKITEIVEGIATISFECIDTGIGIRKEDIDKVFDSFKRVDDSIQSKTEGTGLGLSIVKGYIDLLGGSISVESEYGKGSVFTFSIKQKIIDDSPISLDFIENKQEREKPKFKDVNILAVDDNKMNLKVIQRALRNYGIEPDLADSGQKAIDCCQGKDYDIVLMDQMMPVMDGVEAMKRIRLLERGYEKGNRRKIVALTANAVNGAKEELIEMGFDDFLAKPIDFVLLERLLLDIIPFEKWDLDEEVLSNEK